MGTLPTTKPYRYAARRVTHPTETKQASKIAVGYSPALSTSYIENTRGYRDAQDRLREIADALACSPDDQLAFFASMRDAKPKGLQKGQVVPINSRLDAAKEINRMLPGMLAPQTMHVQSSKTESVSLLIGMIRNNGASIGSLIRQSADTRLIKQVKAKESKS